MDFKPSNIRLPWISASVTWGVFLFFFWSGCNSGTPIILGEGEVVERTASLSPIYGVRSSIPGDIILTQAHDDRPQEIRLKGQENILDLLEMAVERDGILRVGLKDNFRISTSSPVTIEMDISTLRFVELNSSGTITSPATFYRLDELQVDVRGSGTVVLKPEAIRVNAAVYGSGDIQLLGLCGELRGKINGSGSILASGLATNHVKAHIDGSGNMEVQPVKTLEATINGSGDLYYIGNPQITRSINGSGSIQQKTGN